MVRKILVLGQDKKSCWSNSNSRTLFVEPASAGVGPNFNQAKPAAQKSTLGEYAGVYSGYGFRSMLWVQVNVLAGGKIVAGGGSHLFVKSLARIAVTLRRIKFY
jgi:hypothetical protein